MSSVGPGSTRSSLRKRESVRNAKSIAIGGIYLEGDELESYCKKRGLKPSMRERPKSSDTCLSPLVCDFRILLQNQGKGQPMGRVTTVLEGDI